MFSPQPPRLISMQQPQRGPVGMNGGPGPGMYASPHHMRLPGPQHGRLPTAQPRLNGQPYTPMMQPQLQRPVSSNNVFFVCHTLLCNVVLKGGLHSR